MSVVSQSVRVSLVACEPNDTARLSIEVADVSWIPGQVLTVGLAFEDQNCVHSDRADVLGSEVQWPLQHIQPAVVHVSCVNGVDPRRTDHDVVDAVAVHVAEQHIETQAVPVRRRCVQEVVDRVPVRPVEVVLHAQVRLL